METLFNVNRIRAILLALTMLAAGGFVAACTNDEGPFERAGDAIDDAADQAGDAVDDAADEIDDAADEVDEQL